MLSLLFVFSGIGASVLVNPAGAAPNAGVASPAPATTPLTQAEATWAYPNGNAFGQDYSPQNVINSSNAQYLGIKWLFPLPVRGGDLLSISTFAGTGTGVDTAVLIINGTVFAVTQFDQVFALNAANGNVEWTDQIPIFPNSTAGKDTGTVGLHFHDGDVQFTTALFNRTPTFWVSASDMRVYAINALTGQYELNFSVFNGVSTVAGDNPNSIEGNFQANLLIDQSRGILISSAGSGVSAASGRCFYRGWNIFGKSAAVAVDNLLHAAPAWRQHRARPQLGHQPGQQHARGRDLLPRPSVQRRRPHTGFRGREPEGAIRVPTQLDSLQ